MYHILQRENQYIH